MRSSSKALRLILAGVVWLLPAAAQALINPNFTPIHLSGQADVILKLKLTNPKLAGDAIYKVEAAMKGKAPAKVVVGFAEAPQRHAEATRRHLAAVAADTALLFYGTFNGGKLGYLHAGGKWFRLTGGKADVWQLEIISS